MANSNAGESDWRNQFLSMRNAVEQLKEDQKTAFTPLEDLDDDIGEDPPSENDFGDVWDFLSDDESDKYESDLTGSLHSQELINTELTGSSTQAVFDRNWLQLQSSNLAAKSGIDPSELLAQLEGILSSRSSDDELQASLTELLGFDDLDVITDMISNRQAIIKDEPQSKSRDGILGRLHTKKEREEALRRQDLAHKAKPLAASVDREETQYPHVYKTHSTGNTLSVLGKKYALPVGSKRTEHQLYEEYSIPAAQIGTLGKDQSLVQISDMDGLCKGTFVGYKSLNRMQSLLYPVAYKTNENMLVCAPTGAGKTDAAMLTILHTISQNIVSSPHASPENTNFSIATDAFKIVYVAPMKALASEVTEKIGKRLAWLGIKVRELTGDMHLTKREIIETQVIVTTPEKWDVVTRKGTGDTELVQKVRLLIIDEVHMLHDERGAVIESLVARTQRQVESTQSLIRIIGLSATLPNYVDVADFLRVNRMAGLFYFDASFRPVPLEQHFIGVKGKPGSKVSRDNLDSASFEKVVEMLRKGHQVMVFVHSRKDTFSAAKMLYEKAVEHQCVDLFDPQGHAAYQSAVKDMKSSRGRELRELLPKGMGIHHAGMARSDRNLMERLFADGVLKILCCTATLAWGVNLPAAAVIIKGTQLYSSQSGKFVDLGILDVLQIFGRAGRPQFQDTGIGFICTTSDKLQHYLSAVTQQQPIESKFSSRLVDNLNAEIALGTVTSVQEAVQWMGYSYLFVRMKRNPLTYGIDWAEIRDDPQLVLKRTAAIIKAARVLQRSQMIIYNKNTEELRSKDVGRIASQYYVLQSSIEIFNAMMKPQATEADVLRMISLSGEFDNIQARESESRELTSLKDNKKIVPCAVGTKEDARVDQSDIKTNVLLQAYISRARLEDFTLASDSAYVAQNASRICRALFLIALNRRWGYQCLVMLTLCKSIEKQIWPYSHPFHQFDLPAPVLRQLDEKPFGASIEELQELESSELGELVHNQRMGSILFNLLKHFPKLELEAGIAPLNRDVLRIHLYIYADFQWNDKHHGSSESYWIWVENSDTSEIYHYEFFILTRKKLIEEHELHFTIPLSDPMPSQIYIRAVSDRWLGAETVLPVSFKHLIRPDTESVYTDLLNLQPLPVSALKNASLEEIYGQRFQYFNPMQTQIFHTIYNTAENVLLGSPTGSGKTVAAELAMWWAFREHPGSKIVYIAPMKALVRERVQDWRKRLTRQMNLKLVELTGDNTPDTRSIRDADIIVTTPEKWDGISRSWQTRGYVRQVSLVIIDEIHLLGADRGPILEIIVSRMNYIAAHSKSSVRLLGMSTACANATDLGNWLGVKNGLFNFRHSVRPVPLEIFIDGFPEQRGFCALMQSMNRPTFLAIKAHSPDKPVIVFVASRRQTRLTAADLINYCGMEDNPRRFLKMSEEDLQLNLSRVKDESLKEALGFGIGLHHAGLVESDRSLSEELFANNQIQILIATSTLAWGVNLPAHLVVVKGTQFFDAKIEGYKDMDLTDVLQMLGRAGRPQYDTSGIARIFTQDAKKEFYKHFLHTGFPVESSLHNVLDNHLGAEISAGTITTHQDALDYLTWTFFFRRLHKNPSYYGLEISAEEHNTTAAQILANDYMVELVDNSLDDLAESKCIEKKSNGDIDPTPLGKIMSYYYLSHRTIRFLARQSHPSADFCTVLLWMCHAVEYDDLPVRHNEDLINTELAKNLRYGAEPFNLPMWDPHVKAFYLIQAYFSRIELPISDYVTDQNSVLDQSIRIIQASIDVMAERGLSSSCLMMIKLLQCIKSARWPSDNPFLIFPGLESQEKRLNELTESTSYSTLKDIAGLPRSDLEAFARELCVPNRDHEIFLNAVEYIPSLQISTAAVTAIALTIQIKRTNRSKSVDHRMWAPKFPKSQTEGWFVIVREEGSEEILAIKRLSWPPMENRSRTQAVDSAKTTIKLLESTKPRSLNVSVISDGYIGLQYELNGVEIPPAPTTDNDKGKK